MPCVHDDAVLRRGRNEFLHHQLYRRSAMIKSFTRFYREPQVLEVREKAMKTLAVIEIDFVF